MKPDYLTIILTSAAVAAIISSLALVFNEWRRRVSEGRRFALDAAMQIVKLKYEVFMKTIELRQKSGQGTQARYSDPLVNLVWYRKHLQQLLDGKFSDVEREFAKELDEIEKKME